MVAICRDAKRRGIYLALFTDKELCLQFTNTPGGFVKCIFTILVQIQPKFVDFLVFACTTASLIAQISSFENVSKRDAILVLVAKQ